MNIKITINSEERSVVIPLIYEKSTDSLNINEIQIDPIPNKDEDISKDIVLNLTQLIMSVFNNIKG